LAAEQALAVGIVGRFDVDDVAVAFVAAACDGAVGAACKGGDGMLRGQATCLEGQGVKVKVRTRMGIWRCIVEMWWMWYRLTRREEAL
jgi:hypothetical protein